MSKPRHARCGWVGRFTYALNTCDMRTTRAMIGRGDINVNHTFKQDKHPFHKCSPLFIAVTKNSPHMVQLLLESGADLEQKNKLGNTPLFVAVKQHKMAMIRQLVDAGANINHRNNKNETAVFAAVYDGRKDIIEYLASAGADVDTRNADGVTPLQVAIELYENSFNIVSRTRRSAPSGALDVAYSLSTLCTDLDAMHPCFGTVLRLALTVETAHTPTHLGLSRVLMRHGASPPPLMFLRYGGLLATTAPPDADFFTEDFFELAYAAGAGLQRERMWLTTVLTEMPEELRPYRQLFTELLQRSMSPMSLRASCILCVRRQLGGPLWRKIDTLPLPTALKDCLKLT